MKKLIGKVRRMFGRDKRHSTIIGFIILFTLVGAFFLIRTHAATPSVAVEGENGTLSNGATSASDTQASGGKYLKFGSGGLTGGGGSFETWGEHMGISGELTQANIDHVSTLGLKWIKFSQEYGFAAFDTSLITYAHSKGIRVIESCQKSPHSYSLSDIPSFTDWCGAWPAYGVDAIEVGNEWNHYPFWDSAPSVDYSTVAKIEDAAIKAIRSHSATIPIITTGFAGEQSPNEPQEAIGNTLDKSDGTIKAQATYIGHHPYAYNCDSALLCSYPINNCTSYATCIDPNGNHFTPNRWWNTFLASQDVYSTAKSKGLNKPLAFTEIGAPSGNGTNLGTGQPFTVDTQATFYKQYMAGIALMRNSGTPINLILWSTIKDGEAATNSVEQTLGLFDSGYNIKPAGLLVACQATKPWDNSSSTNCWL